MTDSPSICPPHCHPALTELKLYQAFIFSTPILFSIVLLLLFYMLYLRRRRTAWAAQQIRAQFLARGLISSKTLALWILDLFSPDWELIYEFIEKCTARVNKPLEGVLNKSFRDMLPTMVFNESFAAIIKDTQYQMGEFLQVWCKQKIFKAILQKLCQTANIIAVPFCFQLCFVVKPQAIICAVCLGDYQLNEKLQHLPVCGHAFHFDCIDKWLATNTTCPLCRTSLLQATKIVPLDLEAQTATPQQTHDSSDMPPQEVHPTEGSPIQESLDVPSLTVEEHSSPRDGRTCEVPCINDGNTHEVDINARSLPAESSAVKSDCVICIELIEHDCNSLFNQVKSLPC